MPGRFIPAHAGNRHELHEVVHHEPVHPRACGEQVATSIRGTTPNGSSPRMRGTAANWFSHHHDGRFIPAHAGNR